MTRARTLSKIGSDPAIFPGNVNITGVATATTFSGAVTGNVTGNASGSSGSCTGNAAGLTGTPNITVGAINASGISTVGVLTAYSAISADAGIDFSGAQTNAAGMTSETLDAYEEGTFTPTLTRWSPGDMSGVTYNTQGGVYTKIGDIVHAQIRLGVDAGISWGTSSNAIKVGGLPFGFGRVNLPVYKGFFRYQDSSTNYYPTDFMWLSTGTGIYGTDSEGTSHTTEFDGSCTINLIFSYTTTS